MKSNCTIISELQEQIKILNNDNSHLAKQAEEMLLFGSVAEKIGTISDSGALLEIALEQMAILNDIPLCLFCRLDTSQLTIAAAYSTISGITLEEHSVAIPKPDICNFNQCNDSKLHFDLFKKLYPETSFIPYSVLCICKDLYNGEKVVLLLADNHPEHDLLMHEPLFNRIAELVVTRLDNILLQGSLKQLNYHLEERITERTNDLLQIEKQLLHAQKLESLGVLAGGIAHDKYSKAL